MKEIKVHLKKRSYKIVVGNGILPLLGKYLKGIRIGEYAVVITNPTIRKIWGGKINSILTRSGFEVRFEEVADTEKSKSIKTCLSLLNRIAGQSKLKKVFIIAMGGGVVGDIAGFVASIYKRGIPYAQLPTTLVAQADSAIGGKVAVDLSIGKNLAGAFYQPRIIFSEIDFLNTLSLEQLREGLSEVIKYGVIRDAVLFGFIEKNIDQILRFDKKALEFVVERSSRIKAGIVAKDELDRLGLRAALNYGHTIGHAVEAAGGYSKKYSHAKSVSIGIVAANFIARKMDLISARDCARIEALLKRAGLPTAARGLSPARIYEAHLYDKKFIHGKNRFVLSVKIGGIKIVEGVPDKIVKNSIKSICEGKK